MLIPCTLLLTYELFNPETISTSSAIYLIQIILVKILDEIIDNKFSNKKIFFSIFKTIYICHYFFDFYFLLYFYYDLNIIYLKIGVIFGSLIANKIDDKKWYVFFLIEMFKFCFVINQINFKFTIIIIILHGSCDYLSEKYNNNLIWTSLLFLYFFLWKLRLIEYVFLLTFCIHSFGYNITRFFIRSKYKEIFIN